MGQVANLAWIATRDGVGTAVNLLGQANIIRHTGIIGAPYMYTRSNTGQLIQLIGQGILVNHVYNADFNYAYIRTSDNLGQPKDLIGQAIRPRIFRAQPIIMTFWENSDITLPEGYIGLDYLIRWTFVFDPVVSIDSGSLPPGLNLRQPSATVWSIAGVPEQTGNYVVHLKLNGTTSDGNLTLRIVILDYPSDGTGFVGGN